MPRDGSGHGDNAHEQGETLVHGAGSETHEQPKHADKVAPMPEPEKGAKLEGLSGSGGGSAGVKQGEGVGQGGRGT